MSSPAPELASLDPVRPDRAPGRGRLLLGCLFFALLGAAALGYLNGSGLTSGSRYHLDLTQSPHWIAYHGDAFAKDDLLVEYGTFNESPLQNAIYWLGTWYFDVVRFNKAVGMGIFGLTAGLAYGLVASMSGARVGALAALFYIIFPRATYETAGGFSKGWAIGFVLLAVYTVETRRWRILLWSMPLASLAYPVSSVLTGAIVAVGLAMELLWDRKAALRGFWCLSAASVLAVLPLAYKYLTPKPRFGEMIKAVELKALWAKGEFFSKTVPLSHDVLDYTIHPYFIYSTMALFAVVGPRGTVWKRSWSALVIASVIAYYVSDLVVPRLYVPDRYTRFCVAALLVLWQAHNWDRAFEPLRRRWARNLAVVVVAAVAAYTFKTTFRPCQGDEEQGLWENRDAYAAVSRTVAALPGRILVAGHPRDTADLMVQARRPVLLVERMHHAWYRDYLAQVSQRTMAVLSALYAESPAEVNSLAPRYGVTHVLVSKKRYQMSTVLAGKTYRPPFGRVLAGLVRGRSHFALYPPPEGSLVFEDESFLLVQLPLGTPSPEEAEDP